MKNIFIGNLDVTTTEHQLRELFQSYGTVVTVTIVVDRDAGTPRGFAFVEMADDKEADAAIKALHETVLNDRRLAVNEARPKENQDRSLPTERRDETREPLATRKHRRHRY